MKIEKMRFIMQMRGFLVISHDLPLEAYCKVQYMIDRALREGLSLSLDIVVAGEEMAPTLSDLNDRHMLGRLQDSSANDKRSIRVFDVAKESPARQKSQQMRMKSSRLEGYVVDAWVSNEKGGRDGRQQN